MLAWLFPLAIGIAWLPSPGRRAIAGLLGHSRSGLRTLAPAEISIPLLLSAACGAAAVLLSTGAGEAPWQVWVTLPAASLTAVWVSMLAGSSPGVSSTLSVVLAVSAQATAAPWSDSAWFQVMDVPGYLLFSLRWAAGEGAALHGDLYMSLAVFQAVGLAFPALGRLYGGRLSAVGGSRGRRASRSR